MLAMLVRRACLASVLSLTLALYTSPIRAQACLTLPSGCKHYTCYEDRNKILEDVQDAEEKSFTWQTLDVDINTKACSQTIQQTLQASLRYNALAACQRIRQAFHC